jgi:hypothetical protein
VQISLALGALGLGRHLIALLWRQRPGLSAAAIVQYADQLQAAGWAGFHVEVELVSRQLTLRCRVAPPAGVRLHLDTDRSESDVLERSV